MVDFDLRTLSAPLIAMRSKVDVAYKMLDIQWRAIAEELSELPIPCTVSYKYVDHSDDDGWHDYHTLEWRKMKGGKRLCDVHHYLDQGRDGIPYNAETVTPYEEWSAETRLAMLTHVPGLFKAAVEQTEAFVNKVHGKGGGK